MYNCLLYRSDLFFVNVYFSPSSVKESYYLTSANVYVSQNYSRDIILKFNSTKSSALMDKKVIKIIYFLFTRAFENTSIDISKLTVGVLY